VASKKFLRNGNVYKNVYPLALNWKIKGASNKRCPSVFLRMNWLKGIAITCAKQERFDQLG
jgi:hypothetical protein